ncbi:MAG: response regulator [Psychrobacter sp.]
MQQFQSLQRLLIFYTLTLTVMLLLYYVALFHEMKQNSEQQSIDTFYALQHDITEHANPLNSEITKILEKPTFEGISYQLVFMLPSGQTYIHRHTRPNEATFSTITFPKVITSLPSNTSNNSAYTLTAYNLAGTIVFKSGHKLHIILRHKALDIDWLSYRYWLPLMTAIMFFIVALLYMLNRRTNWEQLLLYTDNLGSQAKEAYTPPPFMADKSTAEFLRLGHALSRISYQLHNNHRRIKTLKHRLERLVEQAPLPMLMIMRHGQISFFNQRFEQIFIGLPENHHHYELTDFFAGKDESTQLLLKTLSNLRVTRTVTVYGLQNQQSYQLHITPWFGEHGQVHGFTVLLNSIHEFANQIEQLQQQNQQLQQRIEEFKGLNSVIGHKLRIPLETMIDTLEPIDPQTLSIQQNKTLSVLVKNSQRMLTTLYDILDIEEIEVRKTRLSIQPVDIYKLGQEVNALIIDKTRQQGLELIYFFTPNCPRYIDTDDVRLRQILLNLLHNAINFTTTGYVALIIETISQDQVPQLGKNSLPALNENVAKDQPHHWVRFSVQDTGVGITAIKQSQLLHYFDHSHNYNQDMNQVEQEAIETGLGLNNVNNFARLLGGFIELKSTVDKGSSFDLYLPCRHPNYQSVYHHSPHLTHIHLMAVVSQPLVAEYLQSLCSHLSITATIYTSVDLATLPGLIQQFEKNVQTLAPILLLDYEYRDTRAIIVDDASKSDELKLVQTQPGNNKQTTASDDSQPILNQLLADISLPKLLFSMKPERRIPSILLDKCDGFLTKPLDSALLISELMRLTLPLRQVLAQAHTVKTEVSKPTNPSANSSVNPETALPLILVVEDSPTNQKIACKILSKLGYRSIVAEDGQQALEVLEAQRQEISLILMDCRMPVMDGLQATQAIRVQGDDIPIVALTANNTQEDRDACIQVGMDDFLAKPIDKKQLEVVLQSFIEA